LLARKVQNMIGRPSLQTYLKIVDDNLLKNCPVNRVYILAAEDILGPNVGSLKGKTVRRGEAHVPTSHEMVPHRIMERYRDVTLCIDIMFVNQIPFLVTIARDIKFGTVEALQNRKNPTIINAIKQVSAIYTRRGFHITMGHTDNELNVVSNDEHVPEIERYIRTVKERTRCVYTMLPYRKMPSRMVVEMVKASVFWLNMFPVDDGVSDTMSPREIVAGLQIDFHKHCKLEFGE
jgi:hypothetical protein